MNRHLLLIAAVSSFVACSKAPEGPVAAAPAPAFEAAPVTLELPDDRYEGILPYGAFASVDALCERQRDLVVPHLEAAMADLDPETEMELVPSCHESLEALDGAPVALEAPFLDVKTIEVETGRSRDTFLVVKTTEGWTAVRDAILSQEHDDPGCPSIERESAITEVRVDRGALVVYTTADREDENGPVRLTHARSCRIGDWAPTCSTPETIETTYALTDE